VFHVKQFFTNIAEWFKVKLQWIGNWVFAFKVDPPKLSGLTYVGMALVLCAIGAVGDRYYLSGAPEVIAKQEQRIQSLSKSLADTEQELASRDGEAEAFKKRAMDAEASYAALSAAAPAGQAQPVVRWRTKACPKSDEPTIKLPF
jgi:hypothetical protein